MESIQISDVKSNNSQSHNLIPTPGMPLKGASHLRDFKRKDFMRRDFKRNRTQLFKSSQPKHGYQIDLTKSTETSMAKNELTDRRFNKHKFDKIS